jgi:hypothetical protein
MRYEAFSYIDSSIPEGMTVAEYRRARAAVLKRERKPVRKGPKWFPMPRVRVAF